MANQANQFNTEFRHSLNNSPCQFVNVYVIAAGATATINMGATLPSGATLQATFNMLSFSATGNFFVNFNNVTATGGAKTDGTGDELNPTTRFIRGDLGLSISMYSPNGCTVSVAMYN